VIVHVVLVKWRDRATPAAIEDARRRFLELAAKVPGIEAAYWGATARARSDQFDEGAVLLARDPTAFNAYLAHPDHAPLVEAMNRIVSKFAAANLNDPRPGRSEPRPLP
jgi:hypothetical protein